MRQKMQHYAMIERSKDCENALLTLFYDPTDLIEGENMNCTIIDIRGDYAYVKYDETGIISEVALALLPYDIETGDRMIFEDYEYRKI